MRVAFLLYLGLIPLCFPPWINSSQRSSGSSGYDSLKKYTYLLVELKLTPANGITEIGYASGFFIRDVHHKLFLVSAYHVFTGCDVLMYARKGDTTDALKVWYTDTLGNYRFQQLSLSTYKYKRCDAAARIPDLDTMDVTDYFKDGKINSIEALVPHYGPDYNLPSSGDRVVGYGYPKDRFIDGYPTEEESPLIPKGHVSNVIELAPDLHSLRGFAMNVRPCYKRGFSGAPIFLVRQGDNHIRTIEFAGIQSCTDSSDTHSVIVQGAELGKMLQLN